MSRIIDPDSAGKERALLSKAVVVALRRLGNAEITPEEAQDLAAFIALGLERIAATIEPSLAAWEKRGYWLKADRFRLEWAWSNTLAAKMRLAVLEKDWSLVAGVAVQVGLKLSKITVSENNRLGRPWEGAWLQLQGKKG